MLYCIGEGGLAPELCAQTRDSEPEIRGSILMGERGASIENLLEQSNPG